MNFRYIRLFADDSGESHFEELDATLHPVDFSPPAPPLHLSELFNAKSFAFFGAPAGWVSDWHVSQARNIFVVISGAWEIETSDGEVRQFSPNQTLLVEDTTGKGHRSRVLGEVESLAFLVQLSD
jgi:hypothetical protein